MLLFLVLALLLVAIGLVWKNQPRSVDLSYSTSPGTLVIFSDLRWYPAAPPLNQPCLGQFFPALRVWGDGLVFLDTWRADQSGEQYWTGHLDRRQIRSTLIFLASQGFFRESTPGLVNPAGTSLRLSVNLKSRLVEYSTGDLSPQLYTQLVDQILPQLHPLDQQSGLDSRITSLLTQIQSCPGAAP